MERHPRYPLLERHYDEEHRGRKLEERLEVLKPLRTRTHQPFEWDDRYAPYLHRAKLLPLAALVKAGLPNMDHAALTALVDRWRPETHTFHLPCGELTITLQDVAMLFGLRIDGQAVTGTINPTGWRDVVEALFGVRPEDPPQNAKDRKTSGVRASWLAQHFRHRPPINAPEGVVARYARAWLWQLIGGFLFPDSQGNTLSWMWLPIIGQDWDNIGTYSWGSAVLAWLYRQLCDACKRSGDNANLGGCAYLLQLWMWERLPIGRPERHEHGDIPEFGEKSLGTVGFLSNNVSTVHGNPKRRYIDYTNAMDCLSSSHVNWEPYSRTEVEEMELSPQCKMDADYWRNVCPLICFFVVEYHLPNRVMRQFGHLQACPPEFIDTSKQLHAIERRREIGANNWEEKHIHAVNAWNLRANNRVYGGALHRDGPFNQYLDWLKKHTRLKLKVAMGASNIEDLPSDPEDVFPEYDEFTRTGRQPERGPFEDYIGQQLGRFANEAEQALSVPIGSLEEAGVLRGFIQRFRRGCRKMAFKMNCLARPALAPQHGGDDAGPSRGTARTATPRTRGRATRSTSTGTTSGSRRRGPGIVIRSPPRSPQPATDSEDDNDSEEGDPTYGQEEMGPSQLPDAPIGTQVTPSPGKQTRQRDRGDVGSQNVVATKPGRARKAKKVYTPHP
ncbi:unnamed protein product [Urochloa humidicola]